MAPHISKGQFTADTWDRCGDVLALGKCVSDRALFPGPHPDRKLRLWVVAAVRTVWDLLPDPRSRAAVEAAERFADRPDEELLRHGMKQALEAMDAIIARGGSADDWPWQVARCAAFVAHDALTYEYDHVAPAVVHGMGLLELPDRTPADRQALYLALFRDLFPNPFRPVAFDPAWRTSAAVGLAEAIYAERAWDRMPILADALEDAGCDSAEVLAHCRGGGPHVRGCWAVDAVLGKG